MERAITLVSLFQSSRDERLLPLGCLWLRAACEARGIAVEIRDAQDCAPEAFVDPNRLGAWLGETHDIVGISAMADALPMAVALAQRLKAERPERVVILGGWGPSTVARELVAAFPWLDIVVRGEGDVTLPELIDALAAGASPASVPGATGRYRGLPFHARDRPPVHDVRALVEPRMDDLELADYAYYTTVTARGCPFQCQFCEIPGMEERRVRNRDVDAVVAELVRAYERGVRYVGFQDDIFLLSKKRVNAIVDGLVAAGVDLEFGGFARANAVDPDWLASLGERGLADVTFGIEAGSDAVLKRMTKALTLEKAFTGITRALPAVAVRTFFLWGFPYESLDDFVQTAMAVHHAELLGVRVELGHVVPLPGSPLYQQFGAQLEWHDDYPFGRIIRPPPHPELLGYVVAHPQVFPAFYSFETPDRDAKWRLAEALSAR